MIDDCHTGAASGQGPGPRAGKGGQCGQGRPARPAQPGRPGPVRAASAAMTGQGPGRPDRPDRPWEPIHNVNGDGSSTGANAGCALELSRNELPAKVVAVITRLCKEAGITLCISNKTEKQQRAIEKHAAAAY